MTVVVSDVTEPLSSGADVDDVVWLDVPSELDVDDVVELDPSSLEVV